MVRRMSRAFDMADSNARNGNLHFFFAHFPSSISGKTEMKTRAYSAVLLSCLLLSSFLVSCLGSASPVDSESASEVAETANPETAEDASTKYACGTIKKISHTISPETAAYDD